MDISPLGPFVDFKSTSKHGTTRAALRSLTKHLRSLGKLKGFVSSSPSGKTEQRLFARLNIGSFSLLFVIAYLCLLFYCLV